VKDDVLRQREADSVRLTELSQQVRVVLASSGLWRSHVRIGMELAQRGWSVDRAAVALSKDVHIMAKHQRACLRKAIYAEFGCVPLAEDTVIRSLEESDGDQEAATTAVRSAIIHQRELQERSGAPCLSVRCLSVC
jgi:hypothetical protein